MKRQCSKQEKIFRNHISDEDLGSRICKEVLEPAAAAMSHQTGIQGNSAGAALREGAPRRPQAGRAGPESGPKHWESVSGASRASESLCAPLSRALSACLRPCPGPAAATLRTDPKFAGAKEVGLAAAGVKGACLQPQPTLTQLYGLETPGAVKATGVPLLSRETGEFSFTRSRRVVK